MHSDLADDLKLSKPHKTLVLKVLKQHLQSTQQHHLVCQCLLVTDGLQATSGTINLGGGSVSGGTVSLSNGMLTISVGKSQHTAAAAVSTVFGMDRTLNTNTADTNSFQATMALGGATILLIMKWMVTT